MVAVSQRLPHGATLDPNEAEKVVRDILRLESSYFYWSERFTEMKERVFDGPDAADGPATRFAKALPNLPLSVLLEEREYLFLGNLPRLRGGDRANIMRDAGCLLSAAEIAASIDSAGTSDSLFQDLRAFRLAGEQGVVPPLFPIASAEGRGLRAARELFDVARRYGFANRNEQEFNVPFAELLALHRWEGAFCITPPADSFAHGPLIATNAECRTAGVTLKPAGPERPGFVLVFPVQQGDTMALLLNKMLTRNLLVTGGLDSLVAWHTTDGSDELRQFMDMAKGDSGVKNEFGFGPGLAPSSKAPLYPVLFTNLVMSELEHSVPLPSTQKLLGDVLRELQDLSDAHGTLWIETRARGATTDIHLKTDAAGTSTFLCLRVLAKWYASRMWPRTLLARRDRVGPLNAMPRFSPFLTYLRFHVGDPFFVGILLRALVSLDALYAVWNSVGSAGKRTWGKRLVASLKASHWSSVPKKIKNQLKQDRESWVKVKSAGRGNREETVWRHVGLIDALRHSGTPPAWLQAAQPPSLAIDEAATVVQRTLKMVDDYGLLETLALGFEYTPITTLVEQGVFRLPERKPSQVPQSFRPDLVGAARTTEWQKVEARAPLAKAHNFERLRLVYEFFQTYKDLQGVVIAP